MKKMLIGAVCLLLSSIAMGDDVPYEDKIANEAKSRIIKALGNSGKLHFFRGPNDMIGVGITSANGNQIVVYATDDGRYLFSGVAIESDTGVNISKADLKGLPKPDLSDLYNSVSELSSVAGSDAAGETDTVFNVFVDLNCGYCKRLHAKFKTLRSEGYRFTVNYIPVGVLGPESERMATVLHGLSDEKTKTRLLDEALSGNKLGIREMGFDGSLGDGLENYEEAMKQFKGAGMKGVPATLVKAKSDMSILSGDLSIERLRDILARENS